LGSRLGQHLKGACFHQNGTGRWLAGGERNRKKCHAKMPMRSCDKKDGVTEGDKRRDQHSESGENQERGKVYRARSLKGEKKRRNWTAEKKPSSDEACEEINSLRKEKSDVPPSKASQTRRKRKTVRKDSQIQSLIPCVFDGNLETPGVSAGHAGSVNGEKTWETADKKAW